MYVCHWVACCTFASLSLEETDVGSPWKGHLSSLWAVFLSRNCLGSMVANSGLENFWHFEGGAWGGCSLGRDHSGVLLCNRVHL